MTTLETSRLLKVPEVAQRLRVSTSTAYRWVEQGRLPSLQLGGPGSAVRIDEGELARWLAAHRKDHR